VPTRPRFQEVSPVRLPVFALALGAFAIGTTEFVTMGLLPEMAATFDVSIPTAGWLVTAYALGVVVGAPVLTVLAPTFGVLVASRVVSALTHGAYFGASALVARQLAVPGRRGQAMALVATGVTVANVVGVPLSTAQQAAFNVGNALGAFLAGAVIAAGFGYRAPILVAGLRALLGLGLLLVAERLHRNGRLPVEAPVREQPPAIPAAAS